jgi:ubiquinol-cytochrome c reductase iron-sulfur subunit
MNSMSAHTVDHRRRELLLSGTAAVGGIATVAVAVPFVVSMLPSERATAMGAPVETDIGTIKAGQLETMGWRGKPVWILRRTEEMLVAIEKNEQMLRDPHSREAQQPACCGNPMRSIKPEYFVAIGICTHLGCVPSYVPQAGAAGLGTDWPGGFFCPCHGSKFDLAGRVYRNVPAPANLVIPPHKYLTDTRVVIGEDTL